MGMTPRERERILPTSHYWINMWEAPTNSPQTATGIQRNRRWFWQRFSQVHPEVLSDENHKRIARGVSPRVDRQWLGYFADHTPYKGQTLVHHHIENGPEAAPIPHGLHSKHHRDLHEAVYGPDERD
ncbi:MAG: hypothetical protein ACE14L_14875 [Terriglobales bacterium]